MTNTYLNRQAIVGMTKMPLVLSLITDKAMNSISKGQRHHTHRLYTMILHTEEQNCIAELKGRCKERDEKISGKKDDLIARLHTTETS
jgi:hypothetical protein